MPECRDAEVPEPDRGTQSCRRVLDLVYDRVDMPLTSASAPIAADPRDAGIPLPPSL